MSSEQKLKQASRRQEIKQRRQQRQRMQRLMIFGVVLGVILLIGLFALLPSIQDATRPVGEIVPITPYAFPQPNGKSLGDPNAPVKIQVFEDFQCPACTIYTSRTEKQVIETYVATGQVYYTFHQYPFLDDRSTVKESDQAANGSMCAMEQGRFWDYHDMLYANQGSENVGDFRNARLIAFAEKLGLDMEQFEACFNENRYKDEIDADFQLGNRMGVTGTPAVFVNGVDIAPGLVPDFTTIQQAVEAALAAQP